MSAHGNKESGYILLDAMISVFLIVIGLGSVFGALSTVINYSIKLEEKQLISFETRDEREKNFETILLYED